MRGRSRADKSWVVGVRGAACLVAVVGMVLGYAAPAAARSEAAQTADVAELAAALRSVDVEGWRPAAEALLARLDDPAARAALQGALWDDRPAGVRRAVTEAVVGSPADSSPLARSLGTALAAAVHDGAPEADGLALVRALAKVRSQDAVRGLVESAVMDERSPPAVRAAAMRELARFTGRREFNEDAPAIMSWWGRAQWLSREDWAKEVQSGEPRGAKAAPDVGDQLAVLYRRLYAATPEAGRDALLVEMLESGEPGVRLAAFDLIMLSLVNAKAVGERTAAAAARCLDDDSPRIRAEAARTIELLSRPEDWAHLLGRLAIERDETAAAAMLRAGARHPTDGLRDAAMRWLESEGDETTRTAAAEALEASRRAGLVADERTLERVRATLRAQPAERWSAAWFRLAVGVGLIDEVADELSNPDRTRARLAADALSDSTAGLEFLVRGAERHADLFAPAAAGLQRFAPSVDGYARLYALPAPSGEERAAAINAMVRAMPPMELGRLAASETDLREREALLAPIVTQEFLAGTTDLTERVELALLLARTRILLDRSADALTTIALLPNGWQGPRALALRVTALLCMARIEDADEAASPGAPAEERALSAEMLTAAWLDALEQCREREHGPMIAAEFEKRYSAALSPDQAARWRALTRP